MNTSDETTVWQISYPEKFIAEASKQPFVRHDKALGELRADTPGLLTTFQYEKIDEGCYIFLVDMEALHDLNITLTGDRTIEYYCLSYQLIRGAVNKAPIKPVSHQQRTVLSLPRICSFYNNEFDYQTHFEASSGVRAFIFCFTKVWLSENIALEKVDAEAPFMQVIAKKMSSIAYFNDAFYKDTFDELDRLFRLPERPPVFKMVAKKLGYTLIADFFSIVSDPDSVYNQPERSESDIVVESAKDYLDNRFMDGFPGLEHLAYVASSTVSTLRRRFQNEMGRSPFDYFKEVQMRHAFEQLQTGVQAKAVAANLGFKSYGNFSRAFKQAYKILPTEAALLRPGDGHI